jgi:hypothetical protein
MCGEIVGEVNVFKLNDFELCTDKLPISILYCTYMYCCFKLSISPMYWLSTLERIKSIRWIVAFHLSALRPVHILFGWYKSQKSPSSQRSWPILQSNQSETTDVIGLICSIQISRNQAKGRSFVQVEVSTKEVGMMGFLCYRLLYLLFVVWTSSRLEDMDEEAIVLSFNECSMNVYPGWFRVMKLWQQRS